MELIIKISDKVFSTFKKHGIMTFDNLDEYDKDMIADAIANGTPLPNEQIAWEQGYEAGLAQGKQDRPKGEWINREAISNTIFPFWERYECNQCHKFNGYSNFCPNCGADMRKGDANNEKADK